MPIHSLSRSVRAFSSHCVTVCETIGIRLLLVAKLQEQMVQRSLPKNIHRVLFVCKGNVCRSPLASAYLTAGVRAKALPIRVHSAGLETTPGKPAHQLSRATARRHGLSLEEHATALVMLEVIEEADLILVMEYAQQYRLVSKYPAAARKTFHLRSFYDSKWTDITDPYNGEQEDFEVCYEVIKRSCDRLLVHLVCKAQ
jgi:protein-tyrosine phosphatase